MKKKNIFLIAGFTLILLALIGNANAYTIQGNKVIEEDSISKLSVYPFLEWKPTGTNFKQFLELENKTSQTRNDVWAGVAFPQPLTSVDASLWIPEQYDWVQYSYVCNDLYDVNWNYNPSGQNPYYFKCYYINDNNTGNKNDDFNVTLFEHEFNSYTTNPLTAYWDEWERVSGGNWLPITNYWEYVGHSQEHGYVYKTRNSFTMQAFETKKVKLNYETGVGSGKFEVAVYVGFENCILNNTCDYQIVLDPWWNTDYGERYPVNIFGSHTAIKTTYTHQLRNVDMSSWGCTDSNQVSVVYNGTGTPTEISADVEGICGTTTDANIFWRAQTNIPANTDLNGTDTNGYYVYVTNTTVSNPDRNGMAVYLMQDNFETDVAGQLVGQNGWADSTRWTVLANPSQCYGLQCAYAIPNATHFRANISFPSVSSIMFYGRMKNAFEATVPYGSLQIFDATEESRIYMRADGADMGVFDGGVLTFSEATPDDGWRRFEALFISGASKVTIMDGANPSEQLSPTGTWTNIQSVQIHVADSANGAGKIYVDDLKAYEHIATTPNYSLGAKESGVTNTAPTFDFINPFSVVGGTITISGTCYDDDNDAITIDGNLYDFNGELRQANIFTGIVCDTNTLSPDFNTFTTTWDSSAYTDLNFFIQARADDNASTIASTDMNSASFYVDNTSPTIQIITPTQNQYYSSDFLQFDVNDFNLVSTIVVTLNSNLSPNFNINTSCVLSDGNRECNYQETGFLPNQDNTFVIVATDAFGNSKQASVTFVKTPNQSSSDGKKGTRDIIVVPADRNIPVDLNQQQPVDVRKLLNDNLALIGFVLLLILAGVFLWKK